jgi:hypothetical protein
MDVKTSRNRWICCHQEYGGAAMEYIIVSTFAAVLALTVIGFAGKVFYQQMSKISATLGIDMPQIPDLLP